MPPWTRSSARTRSPTSCRGRATRSRCRPSRCCGTRRWGRRVRWWGTSPGPTRTGARWRRLRAPSSPSSAGPDAYVSPAWYASKATDPRLVPTWNYVTVHVHGPVVVHDDPAWKEALVRAPHRRAGSRTAGRRGRSTTPRRTSSLDRWRRSSASSCGSSASRRSGSSARTACPRTPPRPPTPWRSTPPNQAPWRPGCAPRGGPGRLTLAASRSPRLRSRAGRAQDGIRSLRRTGRRPRAARPSRTRGRAVMVPAWPAWRLTTEPGPTVASVRCATRSAPGSS